MAKQATSSSVTDTLVSKLVNLSDAERNSVFAKLAEKKGAIPEILRDVIGLSKEVEKKAVISYSDLAEMAVQYGWPRNFTEQTAGQRGMSIVKLLSLRAQSRVFGKGKVEEALALVRKGTKVAPSGYLASLKALVESGNRSPELFEALMETVGAVSM